MAQIEHGIDTMLGDLLIPAGGSAVLANASSGPGTYLYICTAQFNGTDSGEPPARFIDCNLTGVVGGNTHLIPLFTGDHIRETYQYMMVGQPSLITPVTFTVQAVNVDARVDTVVLFWMFLDNWLVAGQDYVFAQDAVLTPLTPVFQDFASITVTPATD